MLHTKSIFEYKNENGHRNRIVDLKTFQIWKKVLEFDQIFFASNLIILMNNELL